MTTQSTLPHRSCSLWNAATRTSVSAWYFSLRTSAAESVLSDGATGRAVLMIFAFTAGGRTRPPIILPNIRKSFGQRISFNTVAEANSIRHSVRPLYATSVIDVPQCLPVLPQSCVCQNFVNSVSLLATESYGDRFIEDWGVSICGKRCFDLPGTESVSALVTGRVASQKCSVGAKPKSLWVTGRSMRASSRITRWPCYQPTAAPAADRLHFTVSRVEYVPNTRQFLERSQRTFREPNHWNLLVGIVDVVPN